MYFSIDSGYSRKNQRYAWNQHGAGAVLLRKMESKDLIGKEKRTHKQCYSDIMKDGFDKRNKEEKLFAIPVNSCFDTIVDEDISTCSKPLVSPNIRRHQPDNTKL